MSETQAASADIPVTTSQEPVAQTVDSLPEWAREKLTKANNEAAKYRNEKNDAVSAAKAEALTEYEAKLAAEAEKLAALQTKYTAKELELLKLKAALTAEIPGQSAIEFASLLQGGTEDEIATHAKAVKALFGKTETKDRPTDPTQGTGNVLPLNGDPLLEMVKRVVGA
ncbi:hypothetical protein [Nocardia terpenica]|uniref:Scaffolding protein n=1 Tax=Nocardia terpenica TaxID=455432 RepID=A0A161X709_9NOCA|nr:hypothetical protein [Nocardia terpenica]KZM68838.1 hypothetical protein AWN90_13700 [Nocardia terpenica]NQE88120.1 hypothetical protein [Nocardia terpenica]